MSKLHYKYHFREIEDVKVGMISIIKEIRPFLLNDEYGCILGDDTSGRIPTLVLARTINLYRTRKGLPKLPVYFLQGASADDEIPALEKQYALRQQSLRAATADKRILVVTEGLTSGSSISRLGRLLQRDGMSFDLAVLDGQHFTRDSSRITIPQRSALQPGTPATNPSGLTYSVNNVFAGNSQHNAHTLHAPTPSLGHALSTLSGSLMPIVPLTTTSTASPTVQKHQRVQLQPADPMRSNVLVDAVDNVGWPISTRLFLGKKWAGQLRDRQDLTGLKTEKFPDSLVIRNDPAIRTSIKNAREDITNLATDLSTYLEFSDTAIPRMQPALEKLLRQMRGHVQRDEIAFILGDDTSGRVPTLLIASAINAYRVKQGLPKLPVYFCEGTRESRNADQIRTFEPIAHRIAQLDTTKRALIVTDNIGSGASCRSLIERAHDHGFTSIVATFGGITTRSLRTFSQDGRWEAGTIGYSGEGNPDLVIDKVELSGLTQRRPKFSRGLVTEDLYTRYVMTGIRQDIRHIISALVPVLVPQAVQLDPAFDELVDVLLPVLDQLKHDSIMPYTYACRTTQPFSGIVVEDPIGRIPGLVLRHVINTWRREKGLPPIPLIFLPLPAGKDAPSNLADILAPLDRMVATMPKDSQLLVVSGEMRAGNVIKRIHDHLKNTGTTFSVFPIGGTKHASYHYKQNAILPQDAYIYSSDRITPELKACLISTNNTGITRVRNRTSPCTQDPGQRQSVHNVRTILPQIAKLLIDSLE
ncbi:MAG: hypothetical protein ACP5OR_03265 [Candidatus Dormibacteria bacterium]